MAEDVRVLGDAVPLVKARLEAKMGSGRADGAMARIADELPADWHISTSPLPVVTVNDDGGPVTWPVMARPILRLTAYANGKQTSKNLRRIALGHIMASPIPGIADLYTLGIGYTEARDEETGADVASCTVTATVRTEVITV